MAITACRDRRTSRGCWRRWRRSSETLTPSFRGASETSEPQIGNCTSGNLEIPGSTLSRRPGMTRSKSGTSPFVANGLIVLGADAPRRKGRKLFRRHQLRQRPYRRTANQRALVGQQMFCFNGHRAVVRIADRDQDIADEPVAADALDRRFCKSCAKRRVIKAREFRKSRRTQIVARSEFGFAPGLREFVPWADREAIVAAIDAVADGFPKFVRDRAFVFDGEIGNATPRIELVGRWKRRGRADIETGPARAAMIDVGRIARQLRGGEDRAEKQP